MQKKKSAGETLIPLSERIERLSVKRQEVVRPILEHPRDYVLLSVRAMALRLKSDPATIIRIVHGLGFASYRDFQRHLHELSLAFATSLDTMQQGAHRGKLADPVNDSMVRDLKNLHGMKNSLDGQRLSALARRIYAARRVAVLGGDLATVLADYLGYQLALLGLPIIVAGSPGTMTHTVRGLTQQDLVIGMSFRRGLRQTVEGVQQARARGAYCVGITDTYLSPLARNCDEVFLASIDSVFYGASYTAPIALANAMLSSVGGFKRARTMEIVREMAEEQRRGSRWYDAKV